MDLAQERIQQIINNHGIVTQEQLLNVLRSLESVQDQVLVLAQVLKMMNDKPIHTHRPTSFYTLNFNNRWSTFPDMKTSLTLRWEARVQATYHIVCYSPGNSHLCTKMLIDGKEKEETRSISGNTAYHTNHGSVVVKLPAGTHNFEVIYRTPAICCTSRDHAQDWFDRSIQLVVL